MSAKQRAARRWVTAVTAAPFAPEPSPIAGPIVEDRIPDYPPAVPRVGIVPPEDHRSAQKHHRFFRAARKQRPFRTSLRAPSLVARAILRDTLPRIPSRPAPCSPDVARRPNRPARSRVPVEQGPRILPELPHTVASGEKRLKDCYGLARSPDPFPAPCGRDRSRPRIADRSRGQFLSPF